MLNENGGNKNSGAGREPDDELQIPKDEKAAFIRVKVPKRCDSTPSRNDNKGKLKGN